jgi:hypothetical protein
MNKNMIVVLGLTCSLLLAACGSITGSQVQSRTNHVTATPASQQQESYDMVTLLPPDAIPSIDAPRFYDVSQADAEYGPDETVIGLEVEGEARAYSTALLSSHEIVNDEIKGRPIAVTW